MKLFSDNFAVPKKSENLGLKMHPTVMFDPVWLGLTRIASGARRCHFQREQLKQFRFWKSKLWGWLGADLPNFEEMSQRVTARAIRRICVRLGTSQRLQCVQEKKNMISGLKDTNTHELWACLPLPKLYIRFARRVRELNKGITRIIGGLIYVFMQRVDILVSRILRSLRARYFMK